MDLKLPNTFKKPNDNEAEITLIGTGGYGEAVLIHLGSNNWIIVDSCVNPNTKTPLTIEYLNQIGVDCSKEVKLLICTHWHDDHISGISKALDTCKNAKFVFSKAHDRNKFLRFIAFDYKKRIIESSNSSTLEFNKCIEIIESRGDTILAAYSDRVLYANNLSTDLACQVVALSPSDFTMEKFDQEISTLITEFGSPSKKIPFNKPNAKSVALFIKMGVHRAILGADLEVSDDVREGWVNIINNSQVLDKKASLFKIPHHGSENGYHKDIWSNLLNENPVAKLTPYNKGKGLPDAKMLNKYSQHTDSLYMTAPFVNNNPKHRDKQINKYLTQIGKKLQEVKFKKGIIQSRIKIDDPRDTWKTMMIENSFHVNSSVR